MTDDDFVRRPDAFTLMVRVHGREEMRAGREFNRWMESLQAVIGATSSSQDERWAVGDFYGHWCTNKWGGRYLDKTPYANVWQTIEGEVASRAMAYVWAAVHLVQPLERAGYDVGEINAEYSDEMVALA